MLRVRCELLLCVIAVGRGLFSHEDALFEAGLMGLGYPIKVVDRRTEGQRCYTSATLRFSTGRSNRSSGATAYSTIRGRLSFRELPNAAYALLAEAVDRRRH